LTKYFLFINYNFKNGGNMKHFKSKKIICRNQIIKYLIIIIVVYVTLKISVNFLFNINLLKNIFSFNKTNDYLNIIKDNTINNPKMILNVPINNENSNLIYMETEKETINIVERPSVYIYNSHQTESYSDYNTTVLDAAFIMQSEFDKYNVDVSIEEGDITDFLLTNNMDYNYSYVASRYFIENNIYNNNYDLIIDLHRDAISHDASIININDRICSKILFVVGKNHDNYQENLNLANRLNDLINQKYPNLSRGVILKSGPNVNGLYNQDLSNKMILLELGGNNNSTEEIKNTISLIVPIIGEYLYEE